MSDLSPFLPGTHIQFADVVKLKLYSRSTTTIKFWSRVKITSSGCWISALASNAKGYITISREGRTGPKERLHRVIYEICFGKPINDVLHTCDDRACTCPNHLYDGTAADNTRDMMNKSRGSNQYSKDYNWRDGNVRS